MGIPIAQCHLAAVKPGAPRLFEVVGITDVEAVAQVPTELAVVIVKLLVRRRCRQDPELKLPDLCLIAREDFDSEAQPPSHLEGIY
jgi:hypothetical protein